LQHLRFLAELRAGILIDQELALAQLLHLIGEEVGGDAVAGRVRLVIGEAIVLFLRVGAKRNGCDGGSKQDAAHKQRHANDGHLISPDCSRLARRIAAHDVTPFGQVFILLGERVVR